MTANEKALVEELRRARAALALKGQTLREVTVAEKLLEESRTRVEDMLTAAAPADAVAMERIEHEQNRGRVAAALAARKRDMADAMTTGERSIVLALCQYGVAVLRERAEAAHARMVGLMKKHCGIPEEEADRLANQVESIRHLQNSCSCFGGNFFTPLPAMVESVADLFPDLAA